MQLFILDPEPEAAATMLCDVHLRKMCLETAQILSSVIVRRGGELLPQMPRAYNINHPVITALDTPFKINWAVRHNEGLQREYEYRFGRRHAYWSLTAVYREKLFTAGAVVEDWSFARNFSGKLRNSFIIIFRKDLSGFHNFLGSHTALHIPTNTAGFFFHI